MRSSGKPVWCICDAEVEEWMVCCLNWWAYWQTDSLWELTPIWLPLQEKWPSYWIPMTCQYGVYIIADHPNSRARMILGMASWPYSSPPHPRTTPLLPLPSMDLHLKCTALLHTNLCRVWIPRKPTHYSSWKRNTHSIYNICLWHLHFSCLEHRC